MIGWGVTRNRNKYYGDEHQGNKQIVEPLQKKQLNF